MSGHCGSQPPSKRPCRYPGSSSCTETVEWSYSKDRTREHCRNVTKYRVFRVSWSLPDFRARLNSLKPGTSCWETVSLGGQRVSLSIERRVDYRQPRPRTNLPVEYSDWLELGLRNLSEEILWLSSLQVSLAPPHHQHSQRCGAVDLHQNERLQELPRFLPVTKLRSCVLGPGQTSLDTVWEIRVESEGPRPPPGCLGEERPDLASDLWQLFREDVLTDYTLVCGGEEVRVHRAVLAARAQYWRGALTSGMREATGARAEVSQVARQTLHLLLEFIYTGRIKGKLEPRQMEALLEASNYWGVASLQEQCEEGLILSLNPTNLVDRLVLGDLHHALQLRKVSLQMLVQNVEMLTDIPDWREKLEPKLALEVLEGLAEARAAALRSSSQPPAGAQQPEQVEEASSEEEYQEDLAWPGLDPGDEILGAQNGGVNNVIFNDGVPVAQMM